MTIDKDKDARAGLPGFTMSTDESTKRRKRSPKSLDDVSKSLTYASVPNPLDVSEQKLKTKAIISAIPAEMVYFPHLKEEHNRCAKIMLKNVTQSPLISDDDMIAVANHRIDLLANDPDPLVREAFLDMRNNGYQFYQTDVGNYDEHCTVWFCEELFFKDSLKQVDLADKDKFVELYKKYGNGASTCHVEASSIRHSTIRSPLLALTNACFLLSQCASSGATTGPTPAYSPAEGTSTWTASRRISCRK